MKGDGGGGNWRGGEFGGGWGWFVEIGGGGVEIGGEVNLEGGKMKVVIECVGVGGG